MLYFGTPVLFKKKKVKELHVVELIMGFVIFLFQFIIVKYYKVYNIFKYLQTFFDDFYNKGRRLIENEIRDDILFEFWR